MTVSKHKDREMRQRMFDDLDQLFVQQTNRINKRLTRAEKRIHEADKTRESGSLIRPEKYQFAFGEDELDVHNK